MIGNVNCIEIESLDHPGLEVYSRLTESGLRGDGEIFIVESPKVISVALDSGLVPVSLLCERRHIAGQAAGIIARLDGVPVYTGDREVLAALTGYVLTRGVLCAMRRPEARSACEVCRGARRVAVLDSVVDSTNVGAVFRSAVALGVDAVLLAGGACDPLCRRSVRVSMGAVFLVPWARFDGGPDALRAMGFRTVAMALADSSVPLDSPLLRNEERLAIIIGNEGDGLPPATVAAADYVVRIPMAHGVDSLNAAAAAAVAFWELRVR